MAAGEQMQSDQRALQQAQAMNSAVEASRQRLGGEPSVTQGASSADGSQGEGAQQGEGTQQGQSQAAGSGKAHTWEDEGEFDKGGPHQGSPKTANSGRADDGQVVDDFERFYRASRMANAKQLIASAPGQLDESGHIDTLPTRLSGSDETAERAMVNLPNQYREAAAQAISSEAVPPGYRDAVKQYFDTQER